MQVLSTAFLRLPIYNLLTSAFGRESFGEEEEEDMAHSRRLCGALLQSFSRAAIPHGAGASTFSYIVSRSMSRLFVGGLSFRTEEDGLRTAFAAHGEVIDARIITDRETGRSRGFGFVTYLSEADAETAIGKMDGQFLDGRVIRVNKASPRPAPPKINLDMGSDSSSPAAVEDWGAIPTPNASVPQNAGLNSVGSPDLSSTGLGSSQNFSSPTAASATNELTDLRESKTTTKDTGPSFDFIDLDLSNLPPQDPDRLPRRRPPRPRIRPSSMSDYDYSFPMSESSRFPYNSNFDTGVPKPTGPDFDFDFPEFEEPPIAPLPVSAEASSVSTESSSVTTEASAVTVEVSSVSTESGTVSTEASSVSTEASSVTAQVSIEASSVTAEASSESTESSSVNTESISASST